MKKSENCPHCEYTHAQEQYTAAAAALFEQMRYDHPPVITERGVMLLVSDVRRHHTLYIDNNPTQFAYEFKLVDSKMLLHTYRFEVSLNLSTESVMQLIETRGIVWPASQLTPQGFYVAETEHN